MTDIELINYLLNNKLLPIDIEPAAVLISGSRFFRVSTDKSDYDIILLISNEDFIKYDYLNNKDNHQIINNNYIHFYIWPTNIFLRDHLIKDLKCILGVICAALKPISLQDFILVNNVQLTQAFINCLTNAKTITKLKKLYNESGEYELMKIARQKELYQIKRLYYYLVIYSELTNNITVFDVINIRSKIISYLVELNKDKKYSELSQEETQLINTALDYVLNWFKN